MRSSKATLLFFSITVFFASWQKSEAQWSLTGNTPAANEFIGTTDASNFRFRTNNTERMVILSTGNIGIGITNPTNMLEVNGMIKGVTGISFGSTFGATMDVSGTHARFVANSNTDAITIWGAKNPSSIRLQVNNGGRGIVLDGGSTNFLFMGGSGETLSGIGNVNGSGNLTMLYSTAPNVHAEGARLSTTGNFLIGTTTNGSYKLDVNGTGRYTGALTLLSYTTSASSYMNTGANTALVTTTTGGTPGIQIADATRPSLTLNMSGVVAKGIGIINSSGDIAINVPTFSGANTHIFYGNGKTYLSSDVGVNTTSPSYKLDVNGTARFGSNTLASSLVVNQLGDIGIGMEPTPNMAIQVRKDANATMGIRFENINTGPEAFAALQLGQNISGVNARFLNVGYANPNIGTYGVYRPESSFFVSNGSGGLNMAATHSSGNPMIRFYTGYDVADGNLRMLINENGQVGIGTETIGDANYRLFVETGIRTRKVQVDQTTWPDYVFDQQYKLPTLKEVEAFIQKNKHLPDMPSAAEVEKNGIDLGANQANMLKKIEELTLYVIEQNKKIEEQARTIELIQAEVQRLKNK